MKAKGKELFSGVNLPDLPKGASQEDKDEYEKLRENVRRANAAAGKFFSVMESELSRDIVTEGDLVIRGTFRNRRIG